MLIVPYEPASAELKVLNSRFLARLSPVGDIEEARAFMAGVKAEYPDATHHVPAYIIGGGRAVTEFCSDDGEPSGTSGRPLLAVLKGSGLGNAAIVVTRWFGGSLLGTGGLVKAYSEAGRLVLSKARRAALVESCRLDLDLPYHLFDRFRILCAEAGASIVDEGFSELVHLGVQLPLAGREAFESSLAELSSGQVKASLGSKFLARLLLPPAEP
jgi:uncharacterized YigZ family protein